VGKITRGAAVISWIEEFCRIPEGADAGKPVKLRPWQKRVTRKIYDNPHGTRRAINSFGRKNGKALSLDTPLPTPEGWRTIGDIAPGDVVYGSDGNPCNVLLVSRVFTDKKCYRVGFSDGSYITASADHLWETRHRYRPWAKVRVNGSGNGGRPRIDVVTTDQIFGSVFVNRQDGVKEHNHKIENAKPIISDDIDLPISPYVLGVWLGDGASASARITVGEQDKKFLTDEVSRELGQTVNVRNYADRASTIYMSGGKGADKVQTRLRKLGILGDKAIPEYYFNSGTKQRWSLLQGLMDTDGTVSKCGGITTARCNFVGKNERLVTGVWRLARSLGLKAKVREYRSKLKGKDCGPVWACDFPASKENIIFRLERKQKLLPDRLGKRSGTITITSCKLVDTVETKCLMVDSDNSLFLAGHGCIPTHNTAYSAFLLLCHLMGPEARMNSQLYSAAQSRDQAAILFSLAAKIVRMSQGLSDYVMIRESAKELFCPELGTLYKALSAEASTAYGLSPVFIVHDELGQVKGPRSPLYEALETAVGAQAEPLSIVISTQAPTDGDLLSILIDDAKANNDPRVVLSLYTADPDLDPFSVKAIKQANPAYGDFLNAKEVRAMAEDARRMPAREPQFRNLILNQRVEMNAPFISRSLWTGCQGDVLESFAGYPVYAGLDLSEVSDLTALVLAALVDGKWQVKPVFWLPADGLVEKSRADRVPYDQWAKSGDLQTVPGKSIEYGYIADYMRGIFDNLDIRAVAFDRWNFRHFKRSLIDAGFSESELENKFTEFGQGFQSMSPALRDTESMILQDKLVHGGNPVLTMCAANAVVQSDPSGNRKLTKQKSSGRIDGMVSLVMALAMAATHEEEPEIFNPWDDPDFKMSEYV